MGAAQRRDPSQPGGESIAFMLLAGIGLGALVGWGLDKLIGTSPVLLIVCIFAGFALALYAIYLESR